MSTIPDRLNAHLWRLAQEEARRLAGFDTAPELFLSREQQMLVERISRNGKFNPLAAAGNDREYRRRSVRHPHVVLDLGYVLLRSRLFGEIPREHELGFEYGPCALDQAVQRGGQKPDDRVLHPSLDRRHDLPGVALKPEPVEVLSRKAKLHDEIGGQVLRLSFTALFSPKADEGGFVVAHDDPSVGAADEFAADKI